MKKKEKITLSDVDQECFEAFVKMHEVLPDGACLPEDPCLGCMGVRYLLLALANGDARTELEEALAEAVKEIEEHNSEYEYCTAKDKLVEWKQLARVKEERAPN